MGGEVEEVEPAAGIEKAAEVRVESGVVVGVESYQDSPSAVAPDHPLPETQSVAAAGRVDVGQDSP